MVQSQTGRALTGRSLIAGAWGGPSAGTEAGTLAFRAFAPGAGAPTATTFIAATGAEVDRACTRAREAFLAMAEKGGRERGALLDEIAQRIEDLGEELVSTAALETGLSPARITSERERTVNTLRMFAEVAREGSWVRASIDSGEPSRRPMPRPELRRMLRPLGPAAVFGASNFPLAYSTAGGDTASALAAGCPVVVKGHPSHPGTGELVATAIFSAAAKLNFHPGTFSYLQAGGARESAIGQEVVKHSCIRAVGFTGSFAGGTALAAIAGARPEPIPVFAEMGSVNPVFLLPRALESEARSIAERLFTSVTNSSGQMCTKPGLVFAVRGEGLDVFLRTLADAMNAMEPLTMLSSRIRASFVKRIEEVSAVPGVEVRGGSPMAGHRTSSQLGAEHADGPIRCSPVLLRARYEVFRMNATLRDECFGPATLVVVCETPEQLIEAAAGIHGSLAGAIFAGGLDAGLAKELQRTLEMRVGRVIYNGVPTGVEVCTSMVHGGPHPATNQPHTTAVGPRAIERWCRPVCYQNAPQTLLPAELREGNPLKIARIVDGKAEEVKKA